MAALRSLESHPCSLAPESASFSEEIRQLLYGRRRGMYRILFTICGTPAHVLHVRHAARRWLTPNEE